jgi:N-acetylated-alpha-linked acidic dipeptidase
LSISSWKDEATEKEIVGDITIDEPWRLIEKFSTLTRLSGSADEAEAVRYITDKLTAWGVPHTVHHPTCLISLPGPSTLRTLGANGRSFTVKTSSFSPSTDGREVEAELAYVPGAQAADIGDLLGASRPIEKGDLEGKVVITEGLGIAARGMDFAGSGAIAAIFINPGERIHEGITTTSWGSPDLGSIGRVPEIPILAINKPEGEELKKLLQNGPVKVAFSNQVDTGWREIPVTVAEIKGSVAPDEFILLHGHLDSWHVGISDNATGDATLLEIARVFWKHRDKLARTLRIGWWSGHSHGRYAGSTWYAQEFAQDLAGNCVAHVNCDSPGCRFATEFRDVAWTAEAAALAKLAIKDISGQDSSGGRPLRAGDCSFGNLGISTYFMGLSEMPQEVARAKGYHSVGGSGGNIEWHTEADTIELADRDILLQDIKIYATALLRGLNAPIVPLDYRAAIDELIGHIDGYQQAAGDKFDLSPSLNAARTLGQGIDHVYQFAESLAGKPASDDVVRRVNSMQRMLARSLVTLRYSEDGRFRQDPARGIPPVPELAPANELATVEVGSERYYVLRNDLARAQNRVVWTLNQSLRRLEGNIM